MRRVRNKIMMTETSDYETYKYDSPETSWNDQGSYTPKVYVSEQTTKDLIDGNRRWRKSKGMPRADYDVDKSTERRKPIEAPSLEAGERV
jgi:hypothetical protein